MNAHPMTASERDELISLLQQSQRRYLAAVEGISDESAQMRLHEDSWSILQIAEHAAVAEHGMFRSIELGHDSSRAPEAQQDRTIRVAMCDRSLKRRAPERAEPKGRWKTMAEAIDAFRKSRARTLEMVRTFPDLRSRCTQHPLFGELDAYQVATVMALHAQRHALQIEEIRQKRPSKAS